MNRRIKRYLEHTKSKTKMDNKGQFNFLTGSAIALVVLIIVIMIGAYISSQMGTSLTENSTAWNVTKKGETAFKTYGDWFNIVVIIIIAVAIIGLVMLIGGRGRR